MTKNIYAVALIFLFSSLQLALAQKTIERNFQVQPGGELTVDCPVADITVTGVAGNAVHVKVESSRDLNEIMQFTFDQNGSSVTVKGEKRHKERLFDFLRGNLGFNGHLSITVEVPENYSTSLSSAGGDVEVSRLTGNCTASSSGGNIRLNGVTGSVEAHTSGGSVILTDIRGPVDTHTSGGDIDLSGVVGTVSARTSGGDIQGQGRLTGDCTLKTTGGDITVDSLSGTLQAVTTGGNIQARLVAAPSGDCSLYTTGGNILIRLPSTTSAELSAHTTGGDVESEISVKTSRAKSGSLSGTLGQGGPNLVLQTTGGNIRIKALD